MILGKGILLSTYICIYVVVINIGYTEFATCEVTTMLSFNSVTHANFIEFAVQQNYHK